MPYRSSARDERALRRRAEELEAELEGAALRCRAAAGQLRALSERIEGGRRSLDEAVAEAMDAERRAVRATMAARAEAPSERIGDALRAQGAVAALERALARRGQRPKRASRPPPDLAAARAALKDARLARAKLAAGTDPALHRARQRLADAVASHDQLQDELDEVRRRLSQLTE